MKTPRNVILLIALLPGSGLLAQEKQPLSGMKVVTRYAQPIELDGKIVDEGTAFRVYEVKEAAGDRLRLGWGNAQGWISSSNVIPLDKAVDFYTTEIEDNPANVSAYDWRGMVHSFHKDYDKAIADYDRSIALNPSRPYPWNNRGACRSAKKEYEKAISDFERAIALKPDHVVAICNRGLAEKNLKQYDKALEDYDRAIELKPEFVRPYNERAWLWSTCPDPKFRDGEKAITSATKACDISGWKDANFIDTLAAAYAESGLFEQARRWQEKAVSLTKVGEPQRKVFRDRLELYKKRQPYRLPETAPDLPEEDLTRPVR